MPSLIQGRIVFPIRPVPDPQGRNAKPNRPFVVISSNEEIQAGGLIDLIGITSKNDPEQAENQVELPTGYQALTNLKGPWSAALCTWKIALQSDEFQLGKGFVRPKELRAILQKLK